MKLRSLYVSIYIYRYNPLHNRHGFCYIDRQLNFKKGFQKLAGLWIKLGFMDLRQPTIVGRSHVGFVCVSFLITWRQLRPADCVLSMRGKIVIPMCRLWLHGLHGPHGIRCPLSPKRPLNLITHSLSLYASYISYKALLIKSAMSWLQYNLSLISYLFLIPNTTLCEPYYISESVTVFGLCLRC